MNVGGCAQRLCNSSAPSAADRKFVFLEVYVPTDNVRKMVFGSSETLPKYRNGIAISTDATWTALCVGIGSDQGIILRPGGRLAGDRRRTIR